MINWARVTLPQENLSLHHLILYKVFRTFWDTTLLQVSTCDLHLEFSAINCIPLWNWCLAERAIPLVLRRFAAFLKNLPDALAIEFDKFRNLRFNTIITHPTLPKKGHNVENYFCWSIQPLFSTRSTACYYPNNLPQAPYSHFPLGGIISSTQK